MTDFVFEKGDDVIIELENKILGGVKKAVCSTTNSFTEIGSFLDDEPLCRIPETSRSIILETDAESIAPFRENDYFSSISFSTKTHTLVYGDCMIESMDITVAPNDRLCCKIIISAKESNVYDRQQV